MPTPLIEQLLKGNTERKSGEGKSPLVDYLLNPENQRNAASQPQPELAQEPGLFSLAAKGTARGLIETFPKFAGTATEYLGTRLGVPAMQEAGKVSREFWGKQAEKFNPPESLQGNIWDNPKLMARASWWAYNLPETAVSMASSLIPGGAAYKFLRSAGALQRAALVGASIAGGAAGGALEGANTFEELQKKGASPQEAAWGAELMSAASAGLNAISTGKIFGKGLSSRIVKFITDGTTEGLTEWLEEPSEGLIKMGLGYATPAEVWNQMKEGVNVIPLSFVTGGVAGAVTGDRGTAEKPAVDNTQKRIDAVTGNMSSDDIFDLWQEEEDLDAKQELAKALEEAQKREASGVRPSPINVRKEEPLPVTQTEPVTAEEQPEETEEPEIVSLQQQAEELGIDVNGMDADGAREAIDDFMALTGDKLEETADTEEDYTPEMDDAEFEKTLRDSLDGGDEAESGMGYIVTNIDGTQSIYKNREKAIQFSLDQDKNGNFEQIEYDKISDNAEYADVTPQEPVAVKEEAPVSQEISIKQNEPDFTQPDLNKAELQQTEESTSAQPEILKQEPPDSNYVYQAPDGTKNTYRAVLYKNPWSKSDEPHWMIFDTNTNTYHGSKAGKHYTKEEAIQLADKKNIEDAEYAKKIKEEKLKYPDVWGGTKRLRQLTGYTEQSKFLSKSKEVGYIEQAYDHRITVYYHTGSGTAKNRLVVISEPSGSKNISSVREIDASQYGDQFHWLQRKEIVDIAKKFGADVYRKRVQYSDTRLSEHAPDKPGKLVIKNTQKEPTQSTQLVQNKETKSIEPWQMTRSEYGDVVSKLRAPEAAEMWVKDGIVNKGDDFYRYNIHKLYVKKALSEGKPVPAEVLAEYPDLAEKYGKISKPSEEPTPAEPATKPTVKENLTVAQEPVPVLRGTNVQEKKPESKPINVANGRKGKTYLTDNTEVKFDYAIVELDDLIASHDTDFRVNPEFPSELQPRDRDRFANKVQVEEMSQSINPERLAESSSASTGAPIISEDGVVLSGNGRTIALKKSYQTEKENGYKKWISENSQRFGVNDISGFKNPVLVRIVKSGIDREQFVKSANKTETIGMSATEQAAQDAQIIDDELIDLFNPSADGDLTATSNRMFMNAFLRKLDIGEQAGLLTKEGNYTKALIDRVKAALFEKAYNDKELLSMLAEETDININNIINALVVSSNRYIRAAKVDKSGEIKPLTECVVAAVHVIRKARNEGTPIQEMFRQETFFDEIPIEVKKIASILDADKRSAKRIGYFLSNIADTFSRKKKSDLNEKFFDDPIDFSPISIIDEAIENRREQYGKEGNQGVFDFTGRVGESGKSKGYGGTAPTKSVPGSKESTEEPRFAISPRSKSSTGSTVTSSVQHKDVVEWVARLQKRFSIPIVPVRNINGLPSYYVEAAIRASKERGIVMGLYDPYTEAVWIVSDGIRSKEEFYRTILHETAGHAGLRRIAGKDYENFLLTIANSKRYQDEIYTYAAKNQYDIITATDEWFAEQVETGKIDRSLWSRFVAAIRKAIRNLGINLDFSEQDLKELVRRSYEATTTGTAEGGTALMGQPMFSTAKEQTETPEFKRWFGDSKVVDEDGKPLVVYHGTSNPVFTKFSKNYRGGLGGKLGFWFASTGKAASQFARERFAGQGAGIYPVYLAINNPIEYKGWKEFHSHVEKLRGNKDIEFGTKSLLQQAKKRGFDGIVIRNSDTDMGGMRDDWVAFEPTQIKSAIGNRGTFDPNNPDIRFATQKNQQNINPANILSVPPETWWGLTERTFFDKYNRMAQVQQAYLDNKQPGQSPFNVIDRIRLFMGQTGNQIDELDKRVVTGKDSLLRRMTDDGIGMDEMDLYLYASHAKERNEHVQNINAKFSESEGGSGMTDDEADIALKNLASRGKPFEKYAKEIRVLAKEAMELRFQAGLIDKNTRDRIVSKFKSYVPLKGTSDKSKFSMILGRGFSVTRKEFHRLFGRESKAESPFAQILIDYQEAIIRSQNNGVGNELLSMIQDVGEDNITMPNGKPIFTIEKQKFIPRYDKDGELLYFDPKFQLADNVMAVKRNEMVWEITDGATGMKRYQENQPKKLSGNQTAQQVEKNFTYYITINDRPMAEGMKNLGQTKTIPFIHAVNNYLRMVNTVISPSFIFTNMQRDLETAGLYMLGDENASFMLSVMKDVPFAMKGIWRDVREKTPNQWSDLYVRLKKLGGKVGFFDMQTNEQKLERMKKHIKSLSKDNPLRQARGALVAARDLIMDTNEAVEGGVRLAYFKRLLDKGVDEKKAAIAAKQLTIDFNQRGNWSTTLNTLYLFANANLQGGYRFGKWALKSNKNRAIILSVTMAALMMAMRNRWVGGDDYDRMTDNDKDTHLLFMLPGGKSLSIKVAYGFNVPVAIGNILEESFAGKMSIGGAMSRLMVAMDRAFNPMSGGSWLQVASPTFLDPFVQLAENRNAFGTPIYKEQPAYSASLPDSQLYFKGVNPWLRETALGLNRVTGGTDKISGWMDISPETVEHIAETASGGLGKFVMNTINTGLALSSSEEETEINKIPIVREFVKEPSRWVSASKAREMLKESGRTLYSVDETREYNHLLNEAIKDKSIKPETARRMRTEFRNNQTDARKSLRKAGK